MGAGKTAHKLDIGQPATRENLVDIFKRGYDVIPTTVERQKEYVKLWLFVRGQ